MGKNGNGKKETTYKEIEANTELLDNVDLNDSDEFNDEIITGYDSIPMQQKLGVMQRLVTSIAKDREYRQLLLTAAFDNKHEANLAADAITERLRYGVTIQPIVDRILAQCAVKGARVHEIAEIMTRYQITHNYGAGNVPNWKKKQDQSIGGSKMM